MSLKERLAAQNKQKLIGSGSGSIVDKFKKRDTSVLDKTYDDRDKQSKSGGMGLSIFDPEMLAHFGIEEWFPHKKVGDYLYDLMPISFNTSIPYCHEANVHFAVGFAKDQFLCAHMMYRKACYICEAQSRLYRDKDEYLNVNKWSEERFKNAAKRLYAKDRVIFLIWERTDELLNGNDIDPTLRVWNAPKEAVHQEIQSKVRDRIKRTTLDISDVSPGGEGRTVAMEVSKNKSEAGTFPKYTGFDLCLRETETPDIILEQLNKIITEAEENGFNNALEMLLHNAGYSEIKEAMLTEVDEDEEKERQSGEKADNKASKSSLRERLAAKNTPEPEPEPESTVSSVDETLSLIEAKVAGLKDELSAKSTIGFKAWCMKNCKEALEFDTQQEAIEAIAEDLYENLLAEADVNL